MSSRAWYTVSRRAALTGFALTAAYGSAVAEQVSDSMSGENGAGPVFSPSGPNAELYGAAEGFPIADRSLAHQPGEPIKSNIASAPTATSMKSTRHIGSSARLPPGSSSARKRTSAIIFGASDRPWQSTYRAILLQAC